MEYYPEGLLIIRAVIHRKKDARMPENPLPQQLSTVFTLPTTMTEY